MDINQFGQAEACAKVCGCVCGSARNTINVFPHRCVELTCYPIAGDPSSSSSHNTVKEPTFESGVQLSTIPHYDPNDPANVWGEVCLMMTDSC